MVRRRRTWASVLLVAALLMACCGSLADTADLETDGQLPVLELDIDMSEDSLGLDTGLIEMLDDNPDQTAEVVAPEGIEIADVPELSLGDLDAALIDLDVVAAVPNPSEGGFRLTIDALRLGVGEQYDLKKAIEAAPGEEAFTYKFKSTDRAVVRVSADGVVTGRSKGVATIVVAGPNKEKVECEVSVLDAPQSIQLSLKKPRLEYDPKSGEGESTVLKVKLPEDTASAIRFSGYDKSVVEVSDRGKVTAVGLGETWITAKTFNGLSARCMVRVIRRGQPIRIGNIAHRGGAGYWPENTLEAFRNVASTGATAIELDVQTTADGVQVVHHNKTVKAKGKKYTIVTHTYARLKELKPSLCTLDEALRVIAATKLDLFLEFKSTASIEKCLRLVKRHGMQGRTTFISFRTSQLRRLRALDKQARLGILFSGVSYSLDNWIYRLKPDVLCQKYTYLTQANLRRWQRQGLKVDVWTVDAQYSAERLIEWGVDAITSDYPRMVTQALKNA